MLQNYYEAPLTLHLRVETEGGICGSVIENDKESSIKVTGHEIGNEYDFTNEELTWE